VHVHSRRVKGWAEEHHRRPEAVQGATTDCSFASTHTMA
jgi:hypothetical protein